MARVHADISVELHADLKRICTLKGVTIGQQLRELIEDLVRKEEEKK